jgi:hypothetical protein
MLEYFLGMCLRELHVVSDAPHSFCSFMQVVFEPAAGRNGPIFFFRAVRYRDAFHQLGVQDVAAFDFD